MIWNKIFIGFFIDEIYEKKWSGLCNNDQYDPGQKLYNVSLENCQDECSQNTDCIAFASSPSNVCWITDKSKGVYEWKDSTNIHAACYEKINGKDEIALYEETWYPRFQTHKCLLTAML